MLAAPAAFARTESSGARPININKDSEQILDLLDQAFGPLPSGRGQRMLLSPAGGSFGSLFGLGKQSIIPGFVWLESGRIVGTLSLLRAKQSGKFLVANVAVHEEFRRRGIATELMKTTMDYIEMQGGHQVVLQVDRDNEAAASLYQNLNFQILGDMNHWISSSSALHYIDPPRFEGYRIRRLARGDERMAYNLDIRSLPPNLRWPAPPQKSQYSHGLWRQLNDFLNGRKFTAWIAEFPSDKTKALRPVGLAYIESEWGRPHELAVRVTNDWRGRIEHALVSQLVEYAKRYRTGQFRISHQAEDPLTNELLRDANFRLKRSLRIMRYKISG